MLLLSMLLLLGQLQQLQLQACVACRLQLAAHSTEGCDDAMWTLSRLGCGGMQHMSDYQAAVGGTGASPRTCKQSQTVFNSKSGPPVQQLQVCCFAQCSLACCCQPTWHAGCQLPCQHAQHQAGHGVAPHAQLLCQCRR